MADVVRIIGIGSGHPDHLTSEAADALSSVAYVVAASKGADDPLLAVRQELCDRYGVELVAVADPERDRDAAHVEKQSDYDGAVRDWHAARVAAYREVLDARPGPVGFLVWGDPSLYDSTIRVVEALGVPYDVIPGLSSPQLLAAAHGIVLHPIGRPVLITTGRRLAGDVAAGHENLVVMLDGRLSCLELEDPQEWQIWWGANLGTPSQRLVHGRLDAVAEQLESERTAAAAAGWVMDTYLLRRA
ncbi:precorrin-6A synthase (deacetylating) [Nocardioides marmorisolisilvae]|uniref:Precorrin-6A synthase (Deacetylating) n=1 Tax=Nocardioides marmorisolisilvae TaxID=1542737 RepID=A0A3N0DI45_9ACTN|nr:precorrin-6A synthase (deacetylating) [Nocardioides marmorisolisilvae]RNL75350.1 precorrin-6A synthase (deacetylating) [Nocardioides marmorisolisilvae]